MKTAYYEIENFDKLKQDFDILQTEKQFNVIILYIQADKFYNGNIRRVRKLAKNFTLSTCFTFVKCKCNFQLVIKNQLIHYKAL